MVRTTLNTSFSKRKFIETKGSGKDRLSDLPCHLLCRILSGLSTKDSVRTSVLSSRWRNIWSHVPALDLDFHDFEDDLDDLGEFIDRFMKSNPELEVKRFKFIYDADEHFHDDFVWRLNQVVKRGVSHLTILNMVDVDEALVRMPPSLYSCATLVDLTLYCVVFDHPESELVSLPCVKTMYLGAVKFDGDSVLETLISSCSVLEDLTVITHPDDYLEVVCVRSQSLKRFILGSQRLEGEDDPNVEIDAPRLEYMSISNYQPESFIIHNIGPFAKLNVDVVFDVDHDDPLDITKIPNFLIGISTFHEMTISARTLEVIHNYSEVETLPQFSNLSRLDASLVDSSWEFLPAFLGCCMNLHSLILELDRLPELEEIKLSPVPQCVLSSLDFLHLKTPKTPSKMILATYFRNNCRALTKMLLSGR